MGCVPNHVFRRTNFQAPQISIFEALERVLVHISWYDFLINALKIKSQEKYVDCKEI